MPSLTEIKSQDEASTKEHTAGAPMEYPTKGRRALILLCLVLGTFLVAVDTTIISVAIPRISTDFKALNSVGWYGSAYLMTLTAFQPTMGKVYKMFSPKTAYLACIALFEVGTIICAAAPTSDSFIVGRAVAGLGAAGLIQGALGIITYIAPLEKRQLYIGSVVSVFGISACGGPILGGLICSRMSWRWCFWINVPMGAAILLLVLLSFHLSSVDTTRQKLGFRTKLCSMDPLGILLLLGAVSSLFLVLQQGGNAWSWRSGKVIGLLFTFAVLLTLFSIVQWKLGDGATVPPRLLKDRTILMGSLFLALSNASSYVKLYYVPFYFQAVHSSSAIQSGVQFLSLALPQMVSSLVTSGLVTYTGYYRSGDWISHDSHDFHADAVVGNIHGSGRVGNRDGGEYAYIAIQAVMEREEDVFVGNGIATFVALLGGSLAISIGSTLLDNYLSHFVQLLTPSIPPSAVLRVGALNLPSLASSPTELIRLREAYAKSFDRIMIFALVLTCLGMPVACGMRWFNVKVVAAEREMKTAQLGSEMACAVEH